MLNLIESAMSPKRYYTIFGSAIIALPRPVEFKKEGFNVPLIGEIQTSIQKINNTNNVQERRKEYIVRCFNTNRMNPDREGCIFVEAVKQQMQAAKIERDRNTYDGKILYESNSSLSDSGTLTCLKGIYYTWLPPCIVLEITEQEKWVGGKISYLEKYTGLSFKKTGTNNGGKDIIFQSEI